MSGDGVEEARVRTAVAGHARRRAWAEGGAVFTAVLGGAEVRRVGALVEEEERRAGAELEVEFRVFRDRYAYAVRTGDVELLAGVCAGKHGRWGRICVLEAGHEDRAPHWGTTAEGPVAWIGSAPDDD
ncbi:hypothetical protein AMK21_32295 [Streptomyces sp. CB00316]|uniref:hypothetical protein n=1 Tax=Streptomyces sp. CB00316 TaxID=1703932 RepID=UPI0009399A6B|nr:hypothetical protein [Streptomyces sp. CB00316]OKJ06901.1 hypothetical protein AMK21_32295 [Streptomyces sp. CB00316]